MQMQVGQIKAQAATIVVIDADNRLVATLAMCSLIP